MKLAIAGAGGRMGRVLTRIIQETEGCTVAGGLEPKGSPLVGTEMGSTGAMISDDPAALFKNIDGIVDFTVPAATLSLVEYSARAGIVHVIGTTGIDAAGEEKIRCRWKVSPHREVGQHEPGREYPRLPRAQGCRKPLGEDFDIEVLEMHHRHKIDAPSGTALLLGQAAAAGRKIDLGKRSVRSRDGHTGARPQGDIGFAALQRRFRCGRSYGDLCR